MLDSFIQIRIQNTWYESESLKKKGKLFYICLKLYSCMRFGNNFYSIFTFVINQQEVKKCISFLARFSSFVLCSLTVALQEGSLPRASISIIWICGMYRAARMCKCAMRTQ